MKKELLTVAVSGAFDPIHVGHIRYIHEAAKLGDKLVVILNTDAFLLKKKGFVFFPFKERKEILENIKGVNEVIGAVDEDQTVSRTLEMLKPGIFAKGGLGTGSVNIPEADTCRKIGCKLVTNVGGGNILSDNEISLRVHDLGAKHPSELRITCPYCDNHPMLKGKCIYCGGTGKIEVEKDA